MKALTSCRKGMNMKSVRLPALATLLLAPLAAPRTPTHETPVIIPVLSDAFIEPQC